MKLSILGQIKIAFLIPFIIILFQKGKCILLIKQFLKGNGRKDILLGVIMIKMERQQKDFFVDKLLLVRILGNTIQKTKLGHYFQILSSSLGIKN